MAKVNTPKNQIWIPNGAKDFASFSIAMALLAVRDETTNDSAFSGSLRSGSVIITGRFCTAFTRPLDKILTFACCGMKNKITAIQKSDVNGRMRKTKRLRYEQVKLR